MYFYSKAILPIIKGFEPTQIVQESKSSLVDYRTYSCNTVECTNNFPSYVDCLLTQSVYQLTQLVGIVAAYIILLVTVQRSTCMRMCSKKQA